MRIVFETRGLCPVLGCVCVEGVGGGGRKKVLSYSVHVYCKGMPEMEGIIICHWGHPFFFSPSIFRC